MELKTNPPSEEVAKLEDQIAGMEEIENDLKSQIRILQNEKSDLELRVNQLETGIRDCYNLV